MLVLARKAGQSIRINDRIRLELLSYTEDYVRVSLETEQGKAIINRPMGKPVLDEPGIRIITSHSRGTVRFLIEADKRFVIWREEIWAQMNGQEYKPRTIKTRHKGVA